MSKSKRTIKASVWSGLGLVTVTLLAFWWLFIYSPYPKTPIEIPFDIGREGAVVETDFTIPYTFDTGPNYYEVSIAFKDTNLQRMEDELRSKKETLIESGERLYSTLEKVVGVTNPRFHETGDKQVFIEGLDFSLKLTLTPINKKNELLTYILGSDVNRGGSSQAKDVITPLIINSNFRDYGPFDSGFPNALVKPIVLIDALMGRSFNLRVESVNKVDIPEGIVSKLVVVEGFEPK